VGVTPPYRPRLGRGHRLVRPWLRWPLPPAVPPTVYAALGHRLVRLLKGPPSRELPFSSSAHCRLCAIVPPSLKHRETPPRSPFEHSITTPSSAPTSGAPPTSLPVPSAAPPLHHRRSSPAELSHRGQPTPAILRLSRPHPKHRAA
jgi:hypothetical protein